MQLIISATLEKEKKGKKNLIQIFQSIQDDFVFADLVFDVFVFFKVIFIQLLSNHATPNFSSYFLLTIKVKRYYKEIILFSQ